ncbi:MAG: TolC family protein [Thermoflavifilum sp.]|nr:TolC family protein [Thermoflavifilum sp.]
MKPILIAIYLFGVCIFSPSLLPAQQASPSINGLHDCVAFALRHSPDLQQSYLNRDITLHTIRSKLADWYPQIGFSLNLQHYLQLPTSVFPDFNNPNGPKREVKIGVANSSTLSFSVNQTLFDRDVLLAVHSAGDVKQQTAQTILEDQINSIVNVSKAYYNVLIAQRQLDIAEQDIVRLKKSMEDAYAQYQAGLVDQTDYERAKIALNNAYANRQTVAQQVKVAYAYLKQLMGFPKDSAFVLTYDTAQMDNNVWFDTTQVLQYTNRIEYQLLQNSRRLLVDEWQYNKWSFLPSISAFYNYNLAYLNDQFSQLYSRSFPNSLIGIQLSLPIFQGTKRVQNLAISKLQVQQADFALQSLQNQIRTEYEQALANYKSNLYTWQTLKENLDMARDVYQTLSLQYQAGVKTYLDVITAETDLRTAEFSYLNALLQVLSSKLDLEKAMGLIHVSDYLPSGATSIPAQQSATANVNP